MDRTEIMKILPHRGKMLLLDDVTLDGEYAVGHYTIPADAYFLDGHFPDNPIVPGVILCEILAQSACVLMQDALKQNRMPVYTGLDNVRFRSPVRPGDIVETRCRIKRKKHPFYFAEGTICVGEKLCMSADFSFAIVGV